MVTYGQIIVFINRMHSIHPRNTNNRGIDKYALELLDNVNPNAKVPDSYAALKNNY